MPELPDDPHYGLPADTAPPTGEATLDAPLRRSSRPAHKEPDSIGQYRILERIGEGGMGIVYKAEQREPVRRVVALKVIKLGMDTKEVVARFEAERQALAMLSHPGVARVLDAGMTETGRPYFAMEFVAGIPLTRYCEECKLTTKQRLELFIPICQAVQHAHQKGIIHRDLKPTNILVTLVDGKPAPKIIDFGIAKATNQALTQHTLFTQTGALIGTPEYMSPEQAQTSGLDVDTRTDIYSLGVILYELLTGALPIDPKSLREAGLEGMARLIKTYEPQKPSTRLTSLAGAARSDPTPGPTHNTRLLQKELRGDLDWIVLKAMEKDRSRRYETANALVLDVQRHLDHEPVLARPPSTVYRTQKFIRKHRVAVAAAAMIALVLVLGVATSTILYLKARTNERKAASALAELRSTAPTYISQAKSLFAEQKSSEALAAIEFALRLDPDNADYNLVLAHKLQALARLPEAMESYGKVLTLRPKDASAQSNLELCRQLQKTRLPSGQLPSTSSIALLGALIAEHRTEDLWPLQRIVGRDAEANRALIVSRTRNLASLAGWRSDRITQLDDGTFGIDLQHLAVTDLSWVAGLPISEIDLSSTRIIDITPLSGLPLRKVYLDFTRVSDIGPLRGKPISDLGLSMTGVADLSPLVGMPLEKLWLALCGNIESLAPLRGMPLKELRLSQCLRITDFSPLSQCTQLQRLVLPAGFQDIGLLRRLPNLKKAVFDDSTAGIDWESVPPIERLLPTMERRLAEDAARLKELRAALGRLGMPEDMTASIAFSADGGMNLDLSKYPIADLAFLKGLRIRELFLQSETNQFSDLSPLEGMPIWNLGIVGSRITDLSPLTNCPLNIFRVTNCQSLKDITPLKGQRLLYHVALERTGVGDLRAIENCVTLKELYITDSPVSDLSPLASCTAIQELRAERCPIADLSPLGELTELKILRVESSLADDLRPLRNAKLRILSIGGTRIADFSPLASMTTLEDLSARDTPVHDLSPLTKLTALQSLDLENSAVDDLRPIAELKLRILKIGGTKITDCAPLKSMTMLEDLSATGLPIGNLSVLSQCRNLRMLYIGKIPATDVRPLVGLPLNTLYIDGSQIADVSPLANCTTLEHLLIPRGAKGVEALRNHPRLQRLSYHWDPKLFRVSQTVQEFWAEFDKKPAP